MSDLAVKHRKGARTLEIRGETWTWFRGKSFVEIRSPENKATLVPRETLEVHKMMRCETCGDTGCGYDDEANEIGVTTPGLVANYIRHVILAR
jgi:hypothetical protein